MCAATRRNEAQRAEKEKRTVSAPHSVIGAVFFKFVNEKCCRYSSVGAVLSKQGRRKTPHSGVHGRTTLAAGAGDSGLTPAAPAWNVRSSSYVMISGSPALQ